MTRNSLNINGLRWGPRRRKSLNINDLRRFFPQQSSCQLCVGMNCAAPSKRRARSRLKITAKSSCAHEIFRHTLPKMNSEMTPFVPSRDDLICFISDTYKEINGFRPYCHWPFLTYQRLDEWGKQLSAEVIQHRKAKVLRQRLERNKRRAAQRAWLSRKAEILKPKPLFNGIVIPAFH